MHDRTGIRTHRARSAIAAIALVALAAFALTGCGVWSGSDDSDGSLSVVPGKDSAVFDMPAEDRTMAGAPDMAEVDPAPGTGAGPDASQVPADERYIIRTVGVRVQVDDVEPAVESVRGEVERVGGVVTAVQVSTDESLPIYRWEAMGSLADGAPLRGFVTARVPVDQVDAFLEAVSGLGAVTHQSADESDVTQEHIDLSARLANLEAQETRLREFFDRAENVEDMLGIERELGRVRGEIESITARIAFLERQSAMATVTVELAGRPSIVSPGGSDWGFIDALTRGVRGFVRTINGMIELTMSALPLVIVAALAWLVVRALVRRRRSRDGTAAAGATGDRPDDGR